MSKSASQLSVLAKQDSFGEREERKSISSESIDKLEVSQPRKRSSSLNDISGRLHSKGSFGSELPIKRRASHMPQGHDRQVLQLA